MENPALDALEFFLDNLDDEEILAEMRILTEGDDPYQRMFASFVLFKAGDEQETRVDVLIEGMETLRGEEIKCAQYLSKRLFETGDDPVFIEKFLTLQSHPNSWNRETIVMIVSQFPDAEGIREFLLDSLEDEHLDVRLTAIIALGDALSNTSIYPDDPEIIQLFYDLLDDEEFNTRYYAMQTLSNFISLEETLEIVDDMIINENDSVPLMVYNLLINLEPSEEVNQFLIDRIDENNVSLTSGILGIIASRGENAASAVPALMELLSPQSNGDFIVVLPRDDPLRDSVISALGGIGPPAEDAVPILGAMFTTDFDLSDVNHPDYWLTVSIIEALPCIGGPAVEYLPQIVEVARTQDGHMKIKAIDAVGRFGEQAESWGPELMEIVEYLKSNRPADYMDQPVNPATIGNRGLYCDANYINRIYLALYRIGYEPDAQFESIIAELDGPDCTYAVDVLEEMGAEAVEVLPKLREMAELYKSGEEYLSMKIQILNAIRTIDRLERESR